MTIARIYVREITTRCYLFETNQKEEEEIANEFYRLAEREQENRLESSDCESWNIVDVIKEGQEQ